MSDSWRDSGECFAPAASGAPPTVGIAQTSLRYRLLPDGEFQEAPHLGWKGRMLEIGFGDRRIEIGSPVEIESEYMLYLGELTQRDGSVGSIRVEHALDLAKLAADRDHWG